MFHFVCSMYENKMDRSSQYFAIFIKAKNILKILKAILYSSHHARIFTLSNRKQHSKTVSTVKKSLKLEYEQQMDDLSMKKA